MLIIAESFKLLLKIQRYYKVIDTNFNKNFKIFDLVDFHIITSGNLPSLQWNVTTVKFKKPGIT